MKWLELLDPERLKFVWTAIAGWVFFGLYQLAAVVLAGQPPSRYDMFKAFVNVMCAFVAGILVAYCLGKGFMGLIPWQALRDPSALGFAIGAFTWELAPLGYRIVKQQAAKRGGVEP